MKNDPEESNSLFNEENFMHEMVAMTDDIGHVFGRIQEFSRLLPEYIKKEMQLNKIEEELQFFIQRHERIKYELKKYLSEYKKSNNELFEIHQDMLEDKDTGTNSKCSTPTSRSK
ncbi:hypothetical protein GJ496_003183 [Pomphorhynchus laevis]|nr:hypothetical protein GJ496_003183 [Pomphorhynchus laevis]